jgi:hypothetical protein
MNTYWNFALIVKLLAINNISNCKWLHPQRNDKKEVHGRKVKTDVINKIIKKEYIAKAIAHCDSAPKQQLIINKKPDIVILETAEPAAASYQFVPVLPDKGPVHSAV